MTENQQDFIKFIIKHKSLLFGEFTYKSGRVGPYFFNLGRINSGAGLMDLGNFYAQKIVNEWKDNFDIIFGPAYKGIPLSVAIVSALYQNYKADKRYSSNRKEKKDYGDKSVLLGSELKDGDKIILVDDVLTTGRTKVEAVNLIKSIARVDIKGLVIGLDRMEQNENGQSAVAEFEHLTSIPVKSLISTKEIIEYLADVGNADVGNNEAKKRIEQYLDQYGVKKQSLQN